MSTDTPHAPLIITSANERISVELPELNGPDCQLKFEITDRHYLNLVEFPWRKIHSDGQLIFESKPTIPFSSVLSRFNWCVFTLAGSSTRRRFWTLRRPAIEVKFAVRKTYTPIASSEVIKKCSSLPHRCSRDEATAEAYVRFYFMLLGGK